MFPFLNFVLARAVIENQGVPPEDATRLAVLPAVLGGGLAQSMIFSVLIGRNNAPPAPTPPDTLTEVPKVIELAVDEATKRLNLLGLSSAQEYVTSDRPGIVLAQEPDPGTFVPEGSRVNLRVGLAFVPESGGDNKPVVRGRAK